MADIRISAADLLRLAAIASVSSEGSADEVMAILQRTAPVEEDLSAAFPHLASEASPDADAADDAGADKFAKPE